MEIRQVESSDLASLVQIFRDCWNVSYRDLISEEVRLAMTFDATTQLLTAAANPKDDRFTILASENELDLGFASFGSDPENLTSGHLFSLYVDPQSAGKGVGSKLLMSVIAQLAESGKSEVTLWVFRDNLTAIGLYRKFQFVETGREKTDERWQIPQIEMVRKAITQ